MKSFAESRSSFGVKRENSSPRQEWSGVGEKMLNFFKNRNKFSFLSSENKSVDTKGE
jgi:hypothetical protein